MPYEKKWTVVQHSGMGYAGDTQFYRGLESRMINNKGTENLVLKHGGLIFDTYIEAEDYAYNESYPPDNHSLIPQAPGGFANYEIDGLRIYKPVASIAKTKDL